MKDRVGVFVSAVAVIAAAGLIALRLHRSAQGSVDAGPPFALVDATSGAPFTEQSLLGHATAVFFGFTACPDVCPTGLATASRWLSALGPDAERLQFVFITVDPERDTAERMAAYVSAFRAPIVGLTGPRVEIDRAIARFGVTAVKVPQGDSYTYDHTAVVLLVDRGGQVIGTLDLHDDPEAVALEQLRALIEVRTPRAPTASSATARGTISSTVP